MKYTHVHVTHLSNTTAPPKGDIKQAEFEIRSCPNCIGEECLCAVCMRVSVYCPAFDDSHSVDVRFLNF